METISDIVREMRKRFEPYAKSDSNDARYVAYLGYAEFADRLEAAWEHTRKHSMYCTAHNCKLREIVESVTDCNQHETVDLESRCIYGEVKDAEPASQTMDKWAYPLTNVCKCGNGQEPKPCATVNDANGVVLLHFNGIPWRSNKDSTAMATEFCERMNAQGNKPVGNAAAMRKALVKIYNEIRSYCFDYGAGESHESLVDRILDDPPDYTSYRDSILEIDEIVEAALSEPPRNCDKYSHDEALRIWSSLPESKENGCFDEWLYAEAEGEAK